MGEPCTDEELRLCIISMRATAILAHKSHMRWACDESLPPQVQLMAECHWKSINDYWNIPLDKRIHPEDWPGHSSLEHRRDVANAVCDRATNKG